MVALGTLLTGCANKDASFITTAALCQKLPKPEFQIRGATPYDQNFADETTEVLVAGCGADRPKPRPPEMERVAAVAPPVKKPAPAKRKFLDRFRSKPTS